MHIIRYNRWAEHTMEDADLTAELAAVKGDAEAIRERFAIDLSFGTAGMRGVIGAGTNRMNIYTVRRATQGLANFLRKSGAPHPAVAVSYDSRVKSDLFAHETAKVLAANDIAVQLYPALAPVPALSFAVRRLGCAAGVMITASHNPAKYNGYKVYGPDGCQMNTEGAGAVLSEMERLDIFDDVRCASFDVALRTGLITHVSPEVLEEYYRCVRAQSIRPGLLQGAALRVVYSPLNGAGNVPVRRVLADCGLAGVWVVKEQEYPDGRFPTIPFPNPEYRETLDLGIALARQVDADLVLATDPDADRVGIAAKDGAGQYRLLSGNEVGVLLLDYITSGRVDTGTLPKRPLAVRSIVSTPMADEVARRYGVECVSVLTGFKYIGERVAMLERQGEEGRFLFGFEESYGYLAGSYVRDKDAVLASMLICEAAAYYRGLGLTLHDAMDELYRRHGYYRSEVESFDFEGLAGMEKMTEIMAQLRSTPPADIGGHRVLAVADYAQQTRLDAASGRAETLDLPRSDVLAYTLEGGSLVTVRPSGTEPKVKVYYAVRGDTMDAARALHQTLAAAMRPLLG